MIPLPDLAATERLAEHLAPHLHAGDFLALEGSLGAGKTTFARMLLGRLGVREDVPSPTFTILQIYDAADFSVYHFDLYRLKNTNELDELDWEEAINTGLTIVEWPEHARERLPEDRLTLRFTLDQNNGRSCQIEPHVTWKDRLKDLT